MVFLDIFSTNFLGNKGTTQFNMKLSEGSLIFTRSPPNIAL